MNSNSSSSRRRSIMHQHSVNREHFAFVYKSSKTFFCFFFTQPNDVIRYIFSIEWKSGKERKKKRKKQIKYCKFRKQHFVWSIYCWWEESETWFLRIVSWRVIFRNFTFSHRSRHTTAAIDLFFFFCPAACSLFQSIYIILNCYTYERNKTQGGQLTMRILHRNNQTTESNAIHSHYILLDRSVDVVLVFVGFNVHSIWQRRCVLDIGILYVISCADFFFAVVSLRFSHLLLVRV